MLYKFYVLIPKNILCILIQRYQKKLKVNSIVYIKFLAAFFFVTFVPNKITFYFKKLNFLCLKDIQKGLSRQL